MDLRHFQYWIFDLDGTLTLPQHDFDAIRAELGLPLGQNILESIEARPPEERAALRVRLDAIEREIAGRAEPQPHAAGLLSSLSRYAQVGILTRNARDCARVTLEACGLAPFFEDDAVLSRDDAPPKPSPAGIERLLDRWGGTRARAVVVGDYRWDLMAGRAAGVATIYVDETCGFPFSDDADLCVSSLGEISRALD